MALSKTAILAEGPRKTGSEVWPERNMSGRKRAICVRACEQKTYGSREAAKVVRVLTNKPGVGGDPAFIARLESRLHRTLRKGPPGPRPKRPRR